MRFLPSTERKRDTQRRWNDVGRWSRSVERRSTRRPFRGAISACNVAIKSRISMERCAYSLTGFSELAPFSTYFGARTI